MRLTDRRITEIRHGTRSSYVNHRCRCDECRAANTEYATGWRATLVFDSARIPHGTPGGYTNYGCRCGPCTHAHSLDNARYYAAHRTEASNG